MSDLKIQISEDIKTAMKAGDKFRTGVLRMLLSEIKYDQVAGDKQKELTRDEQLAVVARYHKRLEKSLTDFAGTPKLEELKREMLIIEDYLPKRAGRDEVEAAVAEVLGSSTERNFGLLMKMVMAKLAGSADGKLVSEVLKSRLQP